ncbi:MAG: 2-oxoacid:acceptor oxidoreductase family protein [bacterium]
MEQQGVTEVRIAGFGGQGVILSGMILGRAVSIFENKHATLMQSFGPEARGGACSAQVILSDEQILYPYVKHPDVLVAMSQQALRIYLPTLKPGGKLIYEKDLVTLEELPEGVQVFGIPATKIAEDLRRRIVLNIVMVGFFAAVAAVVPRDAVRKAVLHSVPRGTETLNGRAFDMGYEYGIENYGRA